MQHGKQGTSLPVRLRVGRRARAVRQDPGQVFEDEDLEVAVVAEQSADPAFSQPRGRELQVPGDLPRHMMVIRARGLNDGLALCPLQVENGGVDQAPTQIVNDTVPGDPLVDQLLLLGGERHPERLVREAVPTSDGELG